MFCGPGDGSLKSLVELHFLAWCRLPMEPDMGLCWGREGVWPGRWRRRAPGEAWRGRGVVGEGEGAGDIELDEWPSEWREPVDWYRTDFLEHKDNN